MTTVMPSTHLDTPSAELYAEVTGMLARVTKTMDDDQSIVPSSREETEQALRLALIAMTEAQKRIERQDRRIRELENLSQTDELTGLANRRGFDAALGKALAGTRRTNHSGMLLMIDLDHFKAVNDSFGHAAGDVILKAVADILLAEVRETDTVARLGGDEFAVLIPELDPATVSARMDALSAALNGHQVRWQRNWLSISASVGYRTFDAKTDLAALIDGADRSMYYAKAKRRLSEVS